MQADVSKSRGEKQAVTHGLMMENLEIKLKKNIFGQLFQNEHGIKAKPNQELQNQNKPISRRVTKQCGLEAVIVS